MVTQHGWSGEEDKSKQGSGNNEQAWCRVTRENGWLVIILRMSHFLFQIIGLVCRIWERV